MAISTIDQTGLNAPLTLTSPVLTTPNLGTPSALVLTNATSLPSAALPTGCILQVVQGTSSSQVSTSSSSFVTAGLSATITPKFSTSKILVIAYTAGCIYGPSTASNGNYQIQRSGTVVAGSNSINGGLVYYSSNGEINWPVMLSGLDSPATTSPTTYTMYINAITGNTYAQSNGLPGYIQLLEVAG